MTEDADGDIRPGLAVLQSAEFLYESSMIPDLQYMFKHALTQEVAYKALLQERRLPLHGQVVAGLERLYADHLLPHLERLSYHAFRGELWEKAATYSRRAGAKAIARSASRQAVVYFEQALAALGHLEESREAWNRPWMCTWICRAPSCRSDTSSECSRAFARPNAWLSGWATRAGWVASMRTWPTASGGWASRRAPWSPVNDRWPSRRYPETPCWQWSPTFALDRHRLRSAAIVR